MAFAHQQISLSASTIEWSDLIQRSDNLLLEPFLYWCIYYSIYLLLYSYNKIIFALSKQLTTCLLQLCQRLRTPLLKSTKAAVNLCWFLSWLLACSPDFVHGKADNDAVKKDLIPKLNALLQSQLLAQRLMRKVTLNLQKMTVYQWVVSMIEIAHKYKELTHLHRLRLSTRVHLLSVV